MGQTLDKPVIEKDTHAGENSIMIFGCSSMQGYRVSMEDRHNTITDVETTEAIKNLLQSTKTSLSFFGVYDGHSGDGCAEFLSKNLLKNVIVQQDKNIDTSKPILSNDAIIENGFMQTDQEFANKLGGNDSGSTAVTCFVRRTENEIEIICANTGDSRSVLYNEGKTDALSRDHKPTLEDEKKRIKEAGGYVEFGRVNGTLAVSRAFGDLVYKENPQIDARKQAVTALPEIKRFTIPAKSQTGDFRFIILACDGIWDVMTNEECTKYVRDKLLEQKAGEYWKKKAEALQQQGDVAAAAKVVQPQSGTYDLGSICEDVLHHSVIDLDSKDNVSFALVLFKD